MGNICLTSGNRITPNQLIFPAQCRRQVEGFSPKAAAPMTEAAIPKQPWPKQPSLQRIPDLVVISAPGSSSSSGSSWPPSSPSSGAVAAGLGLVFGLALGGASPASAPPLWFGLRLGLRVRAARGPETAFSSSQLLQSRRPRTKESSGRPCSLSTA